MYMNYHRTKESWIKSKQPSDTLVANCRNGYSMVRRLYSITIVLSTTTAVASIISSPAAILGPCALVFRSFSLRTSCKVIQRKCTEKSDHRRSVFRYIPQDIRQHIVLATDLNVTSHQCTKPQHGLTEDCCYPKIGYRCYTH